MHTCTLKKNISLTWKWIWNKYLYWSVNKRMIRASASGMSGMPTASGMSRSWMPRHASTGTGQSYLSSNVHCQMPCVFDLSIWCFSGLNLFNAKQLLWPPPKLHPLPETAQHLQSACKLQPSHKLCKPMWKFLKYIFIHTCILAHLKKTYHWHESEYGINTCIDQSTNGWSELQLQECPGCQQLQACPGPGCQDMHLQAQGKVTCLQMCIVRCHVCLIWVYGVFQVWIYLMPSNCCDHLQSYIHFLR